MGYKKTALIAITVGFIGVGIQTLSGVAGSFGIYLLGAFIAGFSMCLLNTVVNPMLNTLGGGGNKGNQLIQLGGSFNSLAGTSVIILTGILIPSITNAKISDVFPLMYAALAIFAFAFIVIFFSTIPEKEKQEVKIDTTPSQYGPLSFRHFIFGAIGIFVYVGIEVGVPNVLNKWLQNPDLDVLGVNGAGAEAIAGSVTATYWLLMLVGRLIGASIGSKISAKSHVGHSFRYRYIPGYLCHVCTNRSHGKHAGIQEQCRRNVRTCQCTCQRYVLGVSRTLYIHHVGRYL